MKRSTPILLTCFFFCLLAINSCQENNADKTAGDDSASTAVMTNEKGEPITASGYPYVHHIANKGKRPMVGDRVSYHETILQNDSTIYSTHLFGKPITSVLPGLDKLPRPVPPDYEALLLMAMGDSLTVFQDLDSFDVATLPQGVTNEDQFIYHLQMVEIVPKAIVEVQEAELKAREQSVADSVAAFIDQFEKGTLQKDMKTTESGVQYLVLKEGTGTVAESGKFVTVHFSGFLKDRTNFDNTFKEARPFSFRLDRGRVIKGWDEAIAQMKVGGKVVMFVPYNLAYGVAGKPPTIPEKADLVFYVEVLDVY